MSLSTRICKQGFHTAEAFGKRNKLGKFKNMLCESFAFYLKGQHCPKASCLFFTYFISLSSFYSRIINLLTLWFTFEILSYHPGVLNVLRNPQSQCFQTSHDQECFLRSKNGACHVLQTEQSYISHEISFAAGESCYNISVTIQILCC